MFIGRENSHKIMITKMSPGTWHLLELSDGSLLCPESFYRVLTLPMTPESCASAVPSWVSQNVFQAVMRTIWQYYFNLHFLSLHKNLKCNWELLANANRIISSVGQLLLIPLLWKPCEGLHTSGTPFVNLRPCFAPSPEDNWRLQVCLYSYLGKLVYSEV